jgi:hypothetical protein
MFDKSVEQQERLERLIQEIHDTDARQQTQGDVPNGSEDATTASADEDHGDD